MAWMIDGEVLTERLRGWLESPHGENVYNSGYDDAIWHVLDVIEHMPTITQPNEWVKVMEAINNAAVAYIEGGPYDNDLPGMEFALKIDRLSRDFVRPPEGEEENP